MTKGFHDISNHDMQLITTSPRKNLLNIQRSGEPGFPQKKDHYQDQTPTEVTIPQPTPADVQAEGKPTACTQQGAH